uniref:Uncharacterized protein n=1 Tax=Pinguiococcus pyrenoidosus TaxID=172671 RepID=A0A7R9UEQ5_9STRA|mmetsp:Transcript_5369/g.21274  ORF Transcript_5369/g.21274 Transcript_5369/m.21274 type:complete len:141 (+) Transcript_5369:579-1001(+)
MRMLLARQSFLQPLPSFASEKALSCFPTPAGEACGDGLLAGNDEASAERCQFAAARAGINASIWRGRMHLAWQDALGVAGCVWRAGLVELCYVRGARVGLASRQSMCLSHFRNAWRPRAREFREVVATGGAVWCGDASVE